MATQKMRDKIIDATLSLLAENGWAAVSLDAIADKAGVKLAQLRDAYDSRTAILDDFVRRIDRQVLDNVDAAMADEPARERLFDILFSRFEALEPHRPAFRRLSSAILRDPLFALEINRTITNSMGWMLTAAGIANTGPKGLVRAQGLAIVWGQVMRVWLDDEDPGHARTMAELDKRLRQAERNVMRLERLGRWLPSRRNRENERTETPADAGA